MVEFVVVGLGNPGLKYWKTRHNIGFWFLDSIAEANNLSFKFRKDFHANYMTMSHKESKILFIKPTTYMNDSGRFLTKILSYFKCSSNNIILVHDDLTLPTAGLKISKNRGAGGHNGVASVISFLGNSIIRFRIGIGKNTNASKKLSDFVLSEFSDTEYNLFESNKTTFFNALFSLFENGLESTMNRFNKAQSI